MPLEWRQAMVDYGRGLTAPLADLLRSELALPKIVRLELAAFLCGDASKPNARNSKLAAADLLEVKIAAMNFNHAWRAYSPSSGADVYKVETAQAFIELRAKKRREIVEHLVTQFKGRVSKTYVDRLFSVELSALPLRRVPKDMLRRFKPGPIATAGALRKAIRKTAP